VSDRILVLGAQAAHESIDAVPFDAAASMGAYRHVVVDPLAVPALWQHIRASGGALSGQARADLANRVVQLMRRRRQEATELLRDGGTILCFLRPLGQPVNVVRQGPGGGRTTVLHSYSWLPEEPSLARLVITGSQGADVRAADGAHPAWGLIEAQGSAARWDACVANEQVDPGWHVVATDRLGRLIAFEVCVGEGRLVFVPPVAAADASARGELLAGFFRPTAPAPEATPRPEWLGGVLLPGQGKLAERLEELESEIERLETEFIDLRARHARLADLNRVLYASQGAELAGPAAHALGLLDFEAEPGDDSFIALACPEGRGLAVAAADEAVIDSDPYWALMGRLDERPDEPVRGIIVGNAFCTDPPDARGAPFSDLLRRGAMHRDVCLLSTVELHRAVEAVLRAPDDAALRQKLREAILGTTGPCDLVAIIEGTEESAEP